MLDFYYIHKLREWKKPNGFEESNIKALKLSPKQIVKTRITGMNLIPITDICEFERRHMAFISGLGWIKVKDKNVVEVPFFDFNKENDWKEYIKKYGHYCLYYSLTGCDFFDNDCCCLRGRGEFFSLIYHNVDVQKYQSFVRKIKRIQEIQMKVFSEFDFTKWEIDKLLFYPTYDMGYSWATFPPSVNPVTDDCKLENFYRKKRYNEIVLDYDKDLLKDRLWIETYLDKEIEEGLRFPISVKDRMTFLYGEECSRLYDELLGFALGN